MDQRFIARPSRNRPAPKTDSPCSWWTGHCSWKQFSMANSSFPLWRTRRAQTSGGRLLRLDLAAFEYCAFRWARPRCLRGTGGNGIEQRYSSPVPVAGRSDYSPSIARLANNLSLANRKCGAFKQGTRHEWGWQTCSKHKRFVLRPRCCNYSVLSASQADSWHTALSRGTWKLDTVKTKLATGEPPKELTVIDEQGDNFQVTTTGANADGSPLSLKYTFPIKAGARQVQERRPIRRRQAHQRRSIPLQSYRRHGRGTDQRRFWFRRNHRASILF